MRLSEEAKKIRAALLKNTRVQYGATATAECGRIFDAAYEVGHGDGFTVGQDFACETVLACFILATHDRFGFDADKMKEVWDAVQDRMLDEFSTREAVEKCREIGIEITNSIT